ncbi:MAG: prepilin-type N-terminal cleavage/methylation domain-containing protein [Pyrinomonadaceae bacterium]|nr:prepilin-type N-terminal cleavage/methylation domain-containing protein [Pyrinomonadaceae bacterium]
MLHINNHVQAMRDPSPRRGQSGFSLIEVIVATTVMLVIVGAVFSLVGNSMKVAMTTYELTDAQQNLRIAQEFINRDIVNAGDGLKSIKSIRVPESFLLSYVTLTPVPAAVAGIGELSIFTTDNNVAAGTPITGSVPAATIKTASDRQTILQIDPDFNNGQAIALLPTAVPVGINASGSTITIPSAAGLPLMSIFTLGEVYFFSSGLAGGSGTFGTITAINAGTRQLTFGQGVVPAPGDVYGLNNTGVSGHIKFISTSGTLPTSLQRMRIIQYYVTSTGLLMRRVFGIQGVGVRESIIAEHVVDVQFNYSLIITDALGNVVASQSTVLATSEQQLAVRQVEVKVTVETPHAIQNGAHQSMTMTTSTSVRNMQFRKAL